MTRGICEEFAAAYLDSITGGEDNQGLPKSEEICYEISEAEHDFGTKQIGPASVDSLAGHIDKAMGISIPTNEGVSPIVLKVEKPLKILELQVDESAMEFLGFCDPECLVSQIAAAVTKLIGSRHPAKGREYFQTRATKGFRIKATTRFISDDLLSPRLVCGV